MGRRGRLSLHVKRNLSFESSVAHMFFVVHIPVFPNSVDTALNMQNRKLPCERPEKLYSTYLENRYKLFVGAPKWAERERKDEVDDDLDSDILKVPWSWNSSLAQWIGILIPIKYVSHI